jgi:hypothetical protein
MNVTIALKMLVALGRCQLYITYMQLIESVVMVKGALLFTTFAGFFGRFAIDFVCFISHCTWFSLFSAVATVVVPIEVVAGKFPVSFLNR